MKNLPKRPCAVCDSMDVALLFQQIFSQLSQGALLEGYDVVVCNRCGFGFADHIPNQDAFNSYYRDMSKYEYSGSGGRESSYDLARFQDIADFISPELGRQDLRVLDIGCATGKLLSLLKERGYHAAEGLDPSPICADVARTLHGVTVRTRTIEETARHEAPYDFIILSGVLEHVVNLNETLAAIRDLLTEQGKIFIEVPDATRFHALLHAPFQEFSVEHINFFSPASLANLLSRSGFLQRIIASGERQQTSSAFMPVISAVYQRTSGGPTPLPTTDTETRAALTRYVSLSCQREDHVRRVIDALVDGNKPILIWGAGTQALRLLSTSRLAQANIVAFVDSNQRYQGTWLHGRPVLAPSDMKGRRETIVIASMMHQQEIELQIRSDLGLKNEIIKLAADEHAAPAVRKGQGA